MPVTALAVVDIVVSRSGRDYLLTPQTPIAKRWIRDYVDSPTFEDESLVVEPNFLPALRKGMAADGLRVA